MKRLGLAVVAGLVLTAPGARAADQGDMELSLFGGYNLGGNIDVTDSDLSSKFKTASSFSTGAGLAFYARENMAVELFWGWRPTNITAPDPMSADNVEVASLDEHDLHANFQFMPAYTRSNATPYFLLGLGVTILDPGDVTLDNGSVIRLDSTTKFSWAIGGGVKVFGEGKVGARAQIRYHSTYLTDQADGYWCDPYYGCYTVVDTNWLDEWDFQGALVVRLGGR